MNNLLSNIEINKGSSQGEFIVDSDSTFFTRAVNLSHADGCLWVILGNSDFGCSASTFYLFPQYSSSTGGAFISLTSEGGIRTTALKIDDFDEKLIALDLVKPIQGSTISRPWYRLSGRGTTGNFICLSLKYNLREQGTTSYASPSTFLGAAKIVVSPTS